MKRLLVSTLVVTLLITAVGISGQRTTAAADKPVLVVSTWGYNQDLLDKNITIPFQDLYDCEIVYETGNNSERLSKLIERGDNPGVDVVHFAGSYTYTAMQEGLLQPYDPEQLPNLADLYDWAQDPLGGQYAVGYAVSSYGLFYRTDEIKEPITSWRDLWRDDVKGFVSVPDMGTTNGPATLLMMALAWGGDIDNLEPAWEKLPSLVDQLVTTYMRSSELTSLVQQEEVWVGAVPSFSFAGLTDTGLPIEYVIPEEGLAGFQSVVSVVKGTKNEELAHKYIDFIISHDVQLAEAMDLVDSPTNSTVEVPEDIAAKLTYGEETINSLIFMDEAFVAEHLEEWITRWNELLLQ
jgi:putative spermidine/putrescine transport system substrate-binding protein